MDSRCLGCMYALDCDFYGSVELGEPCEIYEEFFDQDEVTIS